MANKTPSFAISLQKTKIEFFEQKLDQYWFMKHRIDTDAMNTSEVFDAFCAEAKNWQTQTRDVLCWLPEEECHVFEFKKCPDAEAISREYLRKTRIDSLDVVSFVSEPIKNEKYKALVIAQDDYVDAKKFIEAQGFHVRGFAVASASSTFPNPDLYDIKSLIVLAPEIPTFERPKAEEIVKTDAKTKTSTAKSDKKEGENAPKAVISKTDEGASTDEAQAQYAAPEQPKGSIPIHQRYGILVVFALCLLSVSVLAYQQFGDRLAWPDHGHASSDTKSASNPSEITNIKPEIEYVIETPASDAPLKLEQVEETAALQEEVIEFPAAPINFIARPDNHATHMEAFLRQMPDIEIGKPGFQTPARPKNHEEIFIALNAPKINAPPARDPRKIEWMVKRIESNANKPQIQPVVTASLGNANGDVAQNATLPDRVVLNDIALLGIHGPNRSLKAMMRSSGGRVSSLGKGESLDGWSVVAISRSEVIVRKGGTQKRLKVPN